MVMRANPFFNNQVLAQVGNNLAAALYGDPEARFRISQDARAEREMRLREAANTRDGELHDARLGALTQQQAAQQALAEALGRGDFRSGASASVLRGDSLSDALSLFGDSSPAHSAAVDLLNRRGDLDLARIDRQGYQSRLTNEQGFGHRIGEISLANAFDRVLQGDRHAHELGVQQRGYDYDLGRDAHRHGLNSMLQQERFSLEEALRTSLMDHEVAIGGGGGRGGRLPDVSHTDRNGILDIVTKRTAAMFPGAEVDDAFIQEATTLASRLYQQTENVDQAVALAIAELAQHTPGAGRSTIFGIGIPGTGGNDAIGLREGVPSLADIVSANSAARGAGPAAAPAGPAAAPAVDVNAALQEARAAISKGADRAAVAERLRQNGIDPAAL